MIINSLAGIWLAYCFLSILQADPSASLAITSVQLSFITGDIKINEFGLKPRRLES